MSEEEIIKQYANGIVNADEVIGSLINKFKTDELSVDIQQLQLIAEYLLYKVDKLQKENEELKEQRNKLLQKDFKFLTENYIHKDIIKYKIKELKKAPVVYSLTIDILEELLEEIFGAESDIE